LQCLTFVGIPPVIFVADFSRPQVQFLPKMAHSAMQDGCKKFYLPKVFARKKLLGKRKKRFLWVYSLLFLSAGPSLCKHFKFFEFLVEISLLENISKKIHQ
jgi:hypothetical protein